MKRFNAIFIILFLLGISIFSVFKYISALKEKNELAGSLEKLKSEKESLAQSLERQKQLQEQLSQRNSALQENLETAQEQLAQFEEELVQAQNRLAELDSKFSILKAENSALQEEKLNFKNQLARIKKENEEYAGRFNSVSELKKAIRDLRTKAHRVKAEIKKQAALADNTEGNRGFIVRGGKPTYPAQIKIEVKPAYQNE